MFASAWKTFALSGLLILGLGGGAAADDKAKTPAKETADEAKFKAKLKERLDLLRELEKEVQSIYDAGRGTREQVLAVSERVLAAELELCDKAADRIKLYEKLVKYRKEFEELIEAKFKAERCPRTDLLEAKIRRLEAEAMLLHETGKAKSSK